MFYLYRFVLYSEAGDEAILNTLWLKYENADEKVYPVTRMVLKFYGVTASSIVLN